jgi:hypothetical protein
VAGSPKMNAEERAWRTWLDRTLERIQSFGRCTRDSLRTENSAPALDLFTSTASSCVGRKLSLPHKDDVLQQLAHNNGDVLLWLGHRTQGEDRIYDRISTGIGCPGVMTILSHELVV